MHTSISKKLLAGALSAVMVVSLFAGIPANNAKAAASAKMTGKTSVYTGSTYKYKVANVTKKQYVKVSVTGTAKTTVKYNKKVVKATKKIAGGKTITLFVKNTNSAGKKYTLTAKVYNKKTNKVVKTLKKTAKVYAKTTAIALDKTEAALKIGETVTLTATKTPAKNTKAITWATSDASVATVSGGVVTAVGAGTATITATSGAASATATITVAPAEVVVALTGVKQVAANAVTLTFNSDAKAVNKDEIKISAADGSLDIPVNSLEFSADGLTAKAVVATSFTDATAYKVTYKENVVDFTASVGEVASVAITTASAEVNTKTPIEFGLFDANGMDVTSTVKLNETVNISVQGTYSSAELSKASEATLTMTAVGDEATVTVTYNSNKTGATDITASAVVKCIEAKATKGTKLFATTTDINAKSKCAKFYLGLSDETAAVVEDGTNDYLFFCAKDEQGNVISYDSYEVESANDDIASATNAAKDTGKFTQISLAGNKVGTTNVNVKATKNGKDTYYTIPVVVVKQLEAATINVQLTRTSMSNAYDVDYKGAVKVTVLDNAGNKTNVFESCTIELADEKYADTSKYTDSNAFNQEGFKVEQSVDAPLTATYTAYGAKAGSYPIKVTVTKKDGKTIARTLNVAVKALSKDAYDLESEAKGVKATYSIELSQNVLEAAEYETATARLMATVGGVFAGYVRNGEATEGVIATTVGSAVDGKFIHISNDTVITDVAYGAQFGTVYTDGGKLYGLDKATAKPEATAENELKLELASANAGDATKTVVVGSASYDKTFARVGSYTVFFTYVDANKKDKKATNNVTVKNSMFIPTVTVTKRNVDSIVGDDVRQVLKTNVDMNNDDGDYVSIGDTLYSGKATSSGTPVFEEATSTDGNKITVKYVTVVEDDVTFYVPINTTFKAE